MIEFVQDPQNKTIQVDHFFPEVYKAVCKEHNTCPLPNVKVKDRRLHILGDSILLKDWKPLLEALGKDRLLHCVIIQSRLPLLKFDYEAETEIDTRQVKCAFYTAYIMKSLFSSLKKCLSNSISLTYMTLQKIPLRGDLFPTLCEAIKSSRTLQHLSIQMTDMGNEGCEQLCQVLYDKSNLVTLDLSDCQIGSEGAFYIAQLLHHQELNRNLESWKHNLRNRTIDKEYFPGLRRVTINHNKILNTGLADLIHVLLDDKWIKAIDAQDCGITDLGARLVKRLLDENPLIVVFDIRKNVVHPAILFGIFQLLDGRATEKDNELFGWMDESTSDHFLGSQRGCTQLSSNFPQYANPEIELPSDEEYDEKELTIVSPRSFRSSSSSIKSCIMSVEQLNLTSSEDEPHQTKTFLSLDAPEEGSTSIMSGTEAFSNESLTDGCQCDCHKSCDCVPQSPIRESPNTKIKEARSLPGISLRNNKPDTQVSVKNTNKGNKPVAQSNSFHVGYTRTTSYGDGFYNRYESKPRKMCGPPKREQPPPRNGLVPIFSQEGHCLMHRRPLKLKASILEARRPQLVNNAPILNKVNNRGKGFGDNNRTTYGQSFKYLVEHKRPTTKSMLQRKPLHTPKSKQFVNKAANRFAQVID